MRGGGSTALPNRVGRVRPNSAPRRANLRQTDHFFPARQAHFGVTPDVTTMGKVIGGGLPVGAYGGRKDIMEMVAPAGPMYQVAGGVGGAVVE